MNAGLSEAHLQAIERADHTSEVFTAKQSAVLRFAAEVVHDVRATDDTLDAVRKHVSDRQVIELIMCIGLYMLSSRIAENTDVSFTEDGRNARSGHPQPTGRPGEAG